MKLYIYISYNTCDLGVSLKALIPDAEQPQMNICSSLVGLESFLSLKLHAELGDFEAFWLQVWCPARDGPGMGV